MNNSGQLLVLVIVCVSPLLISMEADNTMEKEESESTEVDIVEKEETEFVRLCGDDYNTSGIWEPVRSFAEDRDRLENISLQAHVAARMGSLKDEVYGAIFDTRTLIFQTPGFRDIKFDMIKYHIARTPQNYVYIGKGMKPDCVHFLIRLDAMATQFYLGKHICGVTI